VLSIEDNYLWLGHGQNALARAYLSVLIL
jgi:hypothetical protein